MVLDWGRQMSYTPPQQAAYIRPIDNRLISLLHR